MCIAMVFVVVAALVLSVRAILLASLAERELAELQAISCPICRRNLETLAAVCVIVKTIRKLKARFDRTKAKPTSRKHVSAVR